MRINFSCRFLFPMVLKKDGCRASLRLPVLFLTHHGGLLSFGGMFFRLRAGVVDKVGAVYFSSPILLVVPSFGVWFPRLFALLPGVPPPRLRRPPLNEVNCSALYYAPAGARRGARGTGMVFRLAAGWWEDGGRPRDGGGLLIGWGSLGFVSFHCFRDRALDEAVDASYVVFLGVGFDFLFFAFFDCKVDSVVGFVIIAVFHRRRCLSQIYHLDLYYIKKRGIAQV